MYGWDKSIIHATLTPDQWLFLVPLKGGRWHIIPQLAGFLPLIYHLYIAFWGVICYLPPFMGTRNNHWPDWKTNLPRKVWRKSPAIWETTVFSIVGEPSTQPSLKQQPFAPKTAGDWKTNIENRLGNTPKNLLGSESHLPHRTPENNRTILPPRPLVQDPKAKAVGAKCIKRVEGTGSQM